MCPMSRGIKVTIWSFHTIKFPVILTASRWSVRGTHRSTGAAWPQRLSASAGGRSAAACPAGPEPLDLPGVGSLTG